eukprot:756214-Hanusia_phi.AAC.2
MEQEHWGWGDGLVCAGGTRMECTGRRRRGMGGGGGRGGDRPVLPWFLHDQRVLAQERCCLARCFRDFSCEKGVILRRDYRWNHR